jgi:hypothetical protein
MFNTDDCDISEDCQPQMWACFLETINCMVYVHTKAVQCKNNVNYRYYRSSFIS